MIVGLIYVFFRKVSVHILCPILNGLVCFFPVNLFEFFVNSGYQPFVRCVNCKNVFYPSVGCLFTWLIVSFAVQKLFRSHLSMFAFVAIALGIFVKKSLPVPMSCMVLPRFLSRLFVDFGFILKSLIHLELIFAYGVRKESSFNFLYMASQFSQHHLLNRKSYPHCLFLSYLSNIRWL